MKAYKLRVYHVNGSNKGNLKEELFFETLREALNKYNDLFKKELYGYNPTLWYNDDKNWIRLMYI